MPSVHPQVDQYDRLFLKGVQALKQKIAECCKRLRLSRNIAEICDHVEAESPQAYLLEILQQEIAYRETARKGRLLKQAASTP